MKKILILILLVIVFVNFSVGAKTIKKLYISEVQKEIEKVDFNNEVFTKEEISTLPVPVKKYFRYCGYIGKSKMSNAKVVFDNAKFIQGVDGRTLKLRSEQYNFVSNPSRIVYLNSNIFGIIPFEGRDKYQEGKGAMTAKILKFIPLFDVEGGKMDQAALVTLLSEALFIPSYVLQDYITWKAIDDTHVKASINHKGLKAEGVFTFDKEGRMLKFETNDRYMDKGNGVFEKEKWTAEFSDYAKRNGVKIPQRIKGIWNLDKGDFVYFDGQISEIKYNIVEVR